ncbi:MAG: DNA repair exonuclease [Candidatus Eisenbacteria bacterium]
MKDRILHVADLHLGAPHSYLGPKAAARRTEADLVFHRITEHVLASERIGGVLIAGDLFDHYAPPTAVVESVLTDLARLRAAGIRTLTVPGNHDEYSYPHCIYRERETTWPDTLVTRPTPGLVDTWNLDGVLVDLYAMAYVAGRSRPPFDDFEVEPGPAVKIAVLHGSLDIARSDRSLPLSRAKLERLGLDYVALGHLHQPRETRLGRGWIAYPGRIEGDGFSDPGGSGLLELTVGKDGIAPQRVPFSSRPVETVSWNLATFASETEMDERLEREARRDPGRILRVETTGLAGFSWRKEAIEARWRDRFYHFEMRSHAQPALDLDRLASEPTVRGEFVRVARTHIANAASPQERACAEAALREGLAAFGTGA